MRAIRLLVFTLLSLVLSGCWMLDLPPVPAGSVTLAVPFTLKVGQAVSVAGEPVRVRLEPWADDKRCPQDTACTISAPVKLQIGLWRDDHSTAYPVFTVQTDKDGAVIATAPDSQPEVKVGPYRVKITQVTPYPATREPTPWHQYQATLIITKDPAALPDTDADMSVVTDNPIVLASGEQVTLVGRNVALRVDDVTTNLCTPDQTCDGAQTAGVRLDWLEDGTQTRQITLTAGIDESGLVLPEAGLVQPFTLVDGVGIRLLSVKQAPAEGGLRARFILEPGPRMPTGSEFAEPGAAFTLTPDHTAVIGMDILRVRFDSVLEDSRCPRNVLCIQAGDVQVKVTVSSTEQRATNYTLGGSTDEEGNLLVSPEIDHAGFKLRLTNVLPYPELDASIPITAYVGTFVATAPSNLAAAPVVAPSTAPKTAPSDEILPLLCINEFAAIRLSLGGADEPIMQLTEPIGQDSVTDYGAAHASCNQPFGPEWVQAGPDNLKSMAEHLPEDTPFWIWDGMSGGLVRYPPAP